MKPYLAIVSPGILRFLEHISPLHNIAAVTTVPFIISDEPMDPEMERHESTHVLQQYECGFGMAMLTIPLLLLFGAPWWLFLAVVIAGFLPIIGGFYLLYWAFWWYWFLQASKKPYPGLSAGEMAYYLIPFEREAQLAESLLNGDRTWFGWIHVAETEREAPIKTFSMCVYEWVNS